MYPRRLHAMSWAKFTSMACSHTHITVNHLSSWAFSLATSLQNVFHSNTYLLHTILWSYCRNIMAPLEWNSSPTVFMNSVWPPWKELQLQWREGSLLLLVWKKNWKQLEEFLVPVAQVCSVVLSMERAQVSKQKAVGYWLTSMENQSVWKKKEEEEKNVTLYVCHFTESFDILKSVQEMVKVQFLLWYNETCAETRNFGGENWVSSTSTHSFIMCQTFVLASMIRRNETLFSSFPFISAKVLHFPIWVVW